MIRRIVYASLSLTLLVLLSAVASPIAAGQDLPGLRQILQLPEPIPQVDAGARSLPASEASIFGEDHWIVSVRHCQQRCHHCAHDCSFGYVRSDWNGCATAATDAEFRAWLKPGVPVCIMVHGSFVTADTVTEDSKNTFRWLRQAAPHLPLQVVFLTWPSEGLLTLNPAIATTSAVPGLDVAILGRRAEFNGIRLVKLIQSISPESPISLIGHSHGARIVVSGLNLLGGGELCDVKLCDGPSHRIRTILAGAAIDHDWLCPGQRYEKALNATECLLNIRVRKDWALMIYPLRKPFSRRALGSAGFTEGDLDRFGYQASQVANYDLSELIGYGHIWPEFYQHPSIADALVDWVYFQE
ncbi:MAG: hypothetical protein HQ518_02575 [Rhodopirellula sp.]|nr:hypothetical protein [Rhodopirellula sp.]